MVEDFFSGFIGERAQRIDALRKKWTVSLPKIGLKQLKHFKLRGSVYRSKNRKPSILRRFFFLLCQKHWKAAEVKLLVEYIAAPTIRNRNW